MAGYPFDEHGWRTSENFFVNDFQPNPVSHLRKSRRTAVLLATHAILRTIKFLEGVEKQRAETAVLDAISLAELDCDNAIVNGYFNKFQEVLELGHDYSLGETAEARRGSSLIGEVMVGIWHLATILKHDYDSCWHVLLCARLAIMSNATANERHLISQAERLWQTNLVRDIFPNPFIAKPVMELSWLTTNVVGLARSIYEEKAFERMPILADALMDAGCENEEIIGHCRNGHEHFCGCWLLDLILGKK